MTVCVRQRRNDRWSHLWLHILSSEAPPRKTGITVLLEICAGRVDATTAVEFPGWRLMI